MNSPELTVYNFAVLRAVPHVHSGAFVNVGVVVHERTTEFLGFRAVTDRAELRRRVHDADIDLLGRYLASYQAVCDGAADAGPIAMSPPSERFHWLTSPRSDVLQCSPVHEGIGSDPQRALDELFTSLVG